MQGAALSLWLKVEEGLTVPTSYREEGKGPLNTRDNAQGIVSSGALSCRGKVSGRSKAGASGFRD